MRFMYIVTSAHPGPPTPELLEAMHKLAEREIKAGRMLDNGGLMPLAMGAQVRIKDGQLSVVDGPFVEAKEVIGGYAIFELRDKEEAVASARSGLFRNRGWPMRPRAARSSPNGSHRCWKSSTSFSMKATLRRAATIGCAPSFAMRRFAWAACSPPSRRTSPKPMDCSP